ncbi:metalloregulator ArsR/SmtB family transcription factor [Spirillospora sp. CA-294931]|uniref:ArsR/SmtB family transcription factor n=1 Tax=Spirillospora sp. CA-294931 TaxID=3240042 RepID=UPI003D9199F8
MISFVLGVEDLADTRFAISPLHETVLSLRVLREPGRHALLLPWRRSVMGRLGGVDTRLLLALVGASHALPDFLTPRPPVFAPVFAEELAVVRSAPAALVRRDLAAAHAPDPLPEVLAAEGDRAVLAVRDAVCDVLAHYWRVALEPSWPRLRLVMEADTTYRARRLAVGGARALFADMHPNLRWRDGVLHIGQMIGRHRVEASGRGLLLMPSVFAHKPAPPVSPLEPPMLSYPCRAVATLWAAPPPVQASALAALLGPARARLLALLEEPLPTVELARRLAVTPSAVSQHLRVLRGAGLVTGVRDGRHVLYRRSPLGDGLAAAPPGQRDSSG